jgi:signal transduction histidine kinase
LEEGIIALIGAGKGGIALLKVLLEIPGVKIKYVCDIDPSAQGVSFAKSYGIKYISDYNEILSDEEISLIFEATGDDRLFQDLSRKKSPNISLVGAGGSKIIYNLLDAYNEMNKSLNEYKVNLEEKIIERTEELEKANLDLENEVLEYEKVSRKLQEMNEEKSKYLLYATHQLKAPFSAIQSYADIILEGYSGETSQRTLDIVRKIKQRCELLSNVIQEMLELSRLKSREDDTRMEKVDITAILSKVVQRFKVVWWVVLDSNQWPLRCRRSALTG